MYDSNDILCAAIDSLDVWSIARRSVSISRFGGDSLSGAQAAFFADVPEFTPDQAQAVVEFVRGGGSAMFFVGPSAAAENYNERFAGFLPGRIEKAVGQVGLEAGGFVAVGDIDHPYLAGLFPQPADYPPVIIQRYYTMSRLAGDQEAVFSSPQGEPIILARNFGPEGGRIVLAGTTASVEWNNLATTSLFLPVITRVCLAAGQRQGSDETFSVGSAVRISPAVQTGEKSALNVTMPDGTVELIPFDGGSNVVFTKTDRPGIYRWEATSPQGRGDESAAVGAFAVNPDGSESDIVGIVPQTVVSRIGDEATNIYFGGSLDEVNASAASAAGGVNLWDRLIAVVIVLLVVEAVVANRFRKGDAPSPASISLAAVK
jgi:hypothetical protein